MIFFFLFRNSRPKKNERDLKNLLLSRINVLENEVVVLQENLKNDINGINETCEHRNDQEISLRLTEG